jgi:hypothetical protein
MPNREPYFECVFVVDRNEYRFHFRSPSPVEAERHLRDALRDWGVDAAGEVRVLDGKGRVLLLASYQPPTDHVRA